MYFIAKGSCLVSVKTRNIFSVNQSGSQNPVKKVRTLRERDHFGEISLIYGCRRTATVTSNNYCTIAQITKQDFQDLHTQF